MSNDRQIITYLSPAELVALMNATGTITVHESGISDGKPVIHAALKVVNARTGQALPGGLPFSVVMFKNAKEAGYSNIAIGTIVPAAELNVSLPRDYFNFCNQRFRFARVFPLDERAFVIQMDLVVKNATREYVKFSFGLWGALFSQMLFELMGRGRESLLAAAEAYAVARTDFAEQIVAMPPVVEPEPVMDLAPETVVAAEPVAETVVEEPVAEEPPAETIAVEPPAEEPVAETPIAEPVAEEPVAEALVETPATEPPAEPVPESDAHHGPCEHAEITADPVEGADIVEVADVEEGETPELTIAAGPAAEPVAETSLEPAILEPVAEPVEPKDAV